MKNPFDMLQAEAADMYVIASRMAREEHDSRDRDEVMLNALVDLVNAQKGLIKVIKKRKQEVKA